MNNVLVAIAVLLIAALSALFAVPRIVDWDSYRGVLEEEATRLLGRDVRVGGKLRVHLLPSPTFALEQVRIADREGGTGEPFFRAEQITGRLAVTPLLRGVLQADEIVLKRPSLHVALDERGGGNWSTLGQGQGRLPLAPSDVALQSVKIEAGRLVLTGPDRSERLHLQGIDGEVAAQGLEGPYRFRGAYGAEGARRDLRLTTAKPEADGSVRFKAALKHLETGANFLLDARALDLARIPRVEGELTAQVPLPQVSEASTAGPAGAGSNPAGPGNPKTEPEAPVEVKAALAADTGAVRLSNLTLAFERGGRPQILTGAADFELLPQSVHARASLAARWLDIDQLIGAAPLGPDAPPVAAGPRDGPVSGLLTLATRLNGFNPEQGRLQLTLDVEQANLGREAVSGLHLVIEGSSAETQIKDLRIGLPGGARADIKGLMAGSGDETTFTGDMVLRGASLARFLGWSTAGGFALDPARDGVFAMRARVAADGGGVLARDFVGELAGSVMQGEIGYRWQGRRTVSVLVEGPQVDLRSILPDAAGGAASPLLSHLGSSAALGAAVKDMDVVLRVRAGQLLVPGGSYQDASADIEVRNGRARVTQLRLVAEHGVTLDLEGDMPTAADQPRGTLRGVVSASTEAGLPVAATLVSLPAPVWARIVDRQALVPLRLAGVVSFGATEGEPLEVSADGDVGRSRLVARARLERGAANWSNAPLTVSARMSGATAPRLAWALAGPSGPGDVAPSAVLAQAPNGDATSRVAIDAAGTADLGLVTRISASQGGASITFDGRLRHIPVDGQAAPAGRPRGVAEGRVTVDAPRARNLGHLWPRLADLVAVDEALALSGDASISEDALRVSDITGRLATARVAGSVVVETTAGERRLAGHLNVSTLDTNTLLAPVTAPPATPAADALRAAADVAGTSAGPWPRTPFALTANGATRGEFAVSAARLLLPGGASLADARFAVVVAPGRIEVRDLAGIGAGGAWSGAVKLERTAAAVTGAVVLRAQNVDLGAVTSVAGKPGGEGSAVVTGPVSGLVTLTGSGANPADLVANLSGRGSLATGDVRIVALTPASISSALEAALRGPPESLSTTLRERIGSNLAAGPPVVGPPRSVAFEVRKGVITLAPVSLQLPEGRMTATTAIDLAAMTVAGDWKVEALGLALPGPAGWTSTVTASATPQARKEQPPLPPVVVAFTGPLADLARTRLSVSTEALEREVSVRKMERDLDDLERLRKLDEQRALEEAERRKALESPPPLGALPPRTDAPASAAPTPLPADASTEVSPAPDTIDPSLRPRPQPPAAAAPEPKPAYRPLSTEEQKRIFGGG